MAGDWTAEHPHPKAWPWARDRSFTLNWPVVSCRPPNAGTAPVQKLERLVDHRVWAGPNWRRVPMSTASPSLSDHHELKYVMAGSRADLVHGLLTKCCLTDPDYPEALVSSIYYDTPSWNSLDECLGGSFIKTKIRLRWYADRSSGRPYPDAFVEAKFKLGTRRDKRRVRLPGRAEEVAALRLTDAALRGLPFELRDSGVDVPIDLRPVLHIEYLRRRYVDPRTGARLCVDSNIRVPQVHPRLGLRRTSALPQAVLEHKGDRRSLPPELEHLTAFGPRLGSFSKYAACIQELVHGSLSPS